MGLFGQTPKQTPKEQVCLIYVLFHSDILSIVRSTCTSDVSPSAIFKDIRCRLYHLFSSYTMSTGILALYFSKGKKGKQIFGRLATQGCELNGLPNQMI